MFIQRGLMDEIKTALKALDYLQTLITEDKIYFKTFFEIKKDSVIKAFEITAFNSDPKLTVKKDTVKYLPDLRCYSIEYENA